MPNVQRLAIHRRTAVLAAICGAFLSMTGIVLAIVLGDGGLDTTSTPIVLSIVSALGLALSTLVSALKATEAADSAKDAKRTAERTASDTATIAQLMQSQCGEICPAVNCPFRDDRQVR